MKKKYFILLMVLVCLAMLFSSCLKSDLDSLPANDQAEIVDNGIFFEHRFLDPIKTVGGSPLVQFKRMDVTSVRKLAADTKAESDSLIVSITIPAPDATTSFTSLERTKVSLKSIVCYVNISSAAVVTPIGNSPKLGTPGDYTEARQYKVTAANGSFRIWTIKVKPLPVINKYEGTYKSTGHFDHPTNPRDLNSEKYLSSLDASTVTCVHSDLGSSGYTLNLKVNADNSVTVTQFVNGTTIANSEMVPGAVNKYDPASKTFTLNYRYLGGNGFRTINETLQLK